MYNEVMGMGERTPKNIYTRKKTRKKFPIWFPSHPPVYIKLEADCFPGRKKPETSRTYPRLDRDPNLQR